MAYRVVTISNNLQKYPQFVEDSADFPQLVEYVEDECAVFVVDLSDGDFYPASEFFMMATIKYFDETDNITLKPNDENSLRDIVLNEIKEIRERERNFSKDTMRWRSFWFKKDEGVVIVSSKKERHAKQPIVRLCDSTAADFASLSDSTLLESYKMLIRRQMMQM